MGARPLHYLLTTALPASFGDDWVERFAAGLAEDQRLFRCRSARRRLGLHPGPADPVPDRDRRSRRRCRNPPQRRAAGRPGVGQRDDRRRFSRPRGPARRSPRSASRRPRRAWCSGFSCRSRAPPWGRALAGIAHAMQRRIGRTARRSRPYLRGLRRRRDREARRAAAVCRRPPARRRFARPPGASRDRRRRLRIAVHRAARGDRAIERLSAELGAADHRRSARSRRAKASARSTRPAPKWPWNRLDTGIFERIAAELTGSRKVD